MNREISEEDIQLLENIKKLCLENQVDFNHLIKILSKLALAHSDDGYIMMFDIDWLAT